MVGGSAQKGCELVMAHYVYVVILDLSILIFQQWEDPRLVLNLPDSCDRSITIPINTEIMSKVWIPPVRLVNAIRATTVSAPHLMETIGVTPDGQVNFIRNFEASFPCVTSYKRFPFDNIVCDLFLTAFTPRNVSRILFLSLSALKPGLQYVSFALVFLVRQYAAQFFHKERAIFP